MMIADRHSPLVYGAAVAAKECSHGCRPWLERSCGSEPR
jgi:hypothetical protein